MVTGELQVVEDWMTQVLRCGAARVEQFFKLPKKRCENQKSKGNVK